MAISIGAIFKVKITFKQIILVALLILLAVGSGWLFYKTIFKKVTVVKRSNSEPTAILQNVTTTNYTVNGSIKSHLHAKKLTYYSGLDKSHFLKPVIVVYKPNKMPWRITANYGFSLNKNTILILKKNVRLQQPLGKNNPASIILTSELTIYPNKHFAETKKPVTYTQISQDKTKVTVKSVGAKVDQKTGKIYLLSKARGVYDPNH